MPLFESECAGCGTYLEWSGKWDQEEPFCHACGVQMRRMPSQFGIVWTGPLSASKYNDNKLEGAHVEEHTAYRIKSTRNPDGSPEQVRITNWQERKEFMKAEGLVGIEDVGKIEATETGKHQGKDIKFKYDPTVTITRGPAE
jgi:hypothetical protein